MTEVMEESLAPSKEQALLARQPGLRKPSRNPLAHHASNPCFEAALEVASSGCNISCTRDQSVPGGMTRC